ncbi:hypothetical protein QEH52_02160 [Coraliomargarita sp. SDUM461003]|uniref:Ig-like domain-containing protein n=1 Tax=Thalassobacterium maritimum TaxID=3041265 RepID=A0ABU1AQ40_9BACT|nr:hypothetical protein [Coraliomargarita sp. SDUM461003]MDQ8206294.1 hypothetical protein [Coraliomargarita sp. SDUM461003]
MNKTSPFILSTLLIALLSGCSQPASSDKEAATDHEIGDQKSAAVALTELSEVTDPPMAPTPRVVPVVTEPADNADARPFLELDTDRNGLYDDTERLALLELFQKEVPELNDIIAKKSMPVVQATSNYQEDFSTNSLDPDAAEMVEFTTFDLNGDGKVSIEEQSFERPPLTLLLPQRIIDIDSKIPWSPNIFPEWITTAYLQEDVAVDQAPPFMTRGTAQLEAVQTKSAQQPHKAEAGAGVEFGANTGDYLETKGLRDARWDYRWTLFTFRIDAATGNGEDTVLIDINSGNQPGMSSPKIWYNKNSGLNIQFSGKLQSGADLRTIQTKDVYTDGESWNVVVCGIRYGQMFASVNGVELSTTTPQLPRYSTKEVERKKSYIGSRNKDNAAWAYDAILFGLTEPSEAMVQKMTGWAAHRLDFEQKLPHSHPYYAERPFLDAEDFPYRYNHDDVTWNEWGNLSRSKEITRAHAGQPRQTHEDFERVFYDDFRAKRLGDSTASEGDLWMGFGFNVSVGGAAPLVRPDEKPDAYPYDAENKKQILSLVPQGNKWRGSALYTINDMGYGYSWKGPKIFRIRCMFPEVPQEELAKGLFPAFWSYGIENIHWRTSNRNEIDWFEFDGLNGAWLNGLSTHYHYPYMRGDGNIFAKNKNSHNRFKPLGGPLDEKSSKIPGGIYIWDGQYRTWEFVVTEEMTYVNVSLYDEAGNERMVEVGRVPTPATYLEEVDLQLDYAMKSHNGTGAPKNGERQDFFVDYVEVLQLSSEIEELPAPFISRPTITLQDDNTVVCEANVDGISDLRYYWYADGYPLTYGASNSYKLTKDDIGKNIRCQVKAVGALDNPDAWSNTL